MIDPEFAFYGPIGFDLGAFFGNLLLSWYSQPGHATANDDRVAYQEWILEQATDLLGDVSQIASSRCGTRTQRVMHSRPRCFPLRGTPRRCESARSAFLDSLFADMLGFGACKMIRRILGFAHVIDFECIQDAALRADCEAGALSHGASIVDASASSSVPSRT